MMCPTGGKKVDDLQKSKEGEWGCWERGRSGGGRVEARTVWEILSQVGSFKLRLEIHLDQNRSHGNQTGTLRRNSQDRSEFCEA